jgi:hypothetical protein
MNERVPIPLAIAPQETIDRAHTVVIDCEVLN